MKIYALGTCDPNCPFCAREAWRWVKGQLSRRWGGEKFYDHAATSNIGPGPGEPHRNVNGEHFVSSVAPWIDDRFLRPEG